MNAFTAETSNHIEVVDVTDRVRDHVPDGVSGVCTVFSRHTTAGVLLQEAEPKLMTDIESYLDEAVPDEGHRHDALDGNADSHLRASLVGSDVSIPVDDGEPSLGTWQSILLVECDGPRSRDVVVQTASVS